MAMYDTESFLKQLETMYKANLNARIAAINTEKGDFEIAQINSNAWYFQNLNDKVFSYPVIIVWGLEPNPNVSESQNDNYIKQVKVFIEAAMPDKGSASAQNVMWQLLRYTRALEEVAFKNFDAFQGYAKLKVDSLEPTSFLLNGNMFRSAGVNVIASMTAY